MTFFAKINPYISQFNYSIICKIISTSNRYVMLIGCAMHDCLICAKILFFDDFPGASFAFGAAYDSLLGEAGGDGFDGALRFTYITGNKLLWGRWVLLYHSQHGLFLQIAVFALRRQPKGIICTCKCRRSSTSCSSVKQCKHSE